MDDTPLVWDPGGSQLDILGVKIFQGANKSYIEILEKSKEILQKWGKQNISLYGKVVMINALVGSLFVYKMQVLCDPDENVYKQFYKLLEKFLWKGKRPKIKTKILCSSKKEGGLNLVNLEFKNQALKVSWIFRKENQIQDLLNHIVPDEMGTIFWDCQLKSTDLWEIKIQDPFWRSVVKAWFNFTWLPELNDNQIMSQIIWYNSRIRVNDRIIQNAKATNAGLIYVVQLYVGESLKSFDQISKEFLNALTWFEYVQNIMAIPSNFKKNTKQGQTNSEYV